MALGTSVALVVVGALSQAQLNIGAQGEDGLRRSPLTGSQAQSVAQRASLELGLAGAGAALGLGLGTTAVVLW